MFTKKITRAAKVEVLNPSKKKKKKAAAKKAVKAKPKVGGRMKMDAPEERYRKKTAKKAVKKVTRVRRVQDQAIENAEAVQKRPGAKLPRAGDEINQHGTNSASNSAVAVEPPAPVQDERQKLLAYNFAVGTKYMIDGTIFTVKQGYKDSNTEFRRVFSFENGEEVLDLGFMMRDKFDPSFRLVE